MVSKDGGLGLDVARDSATRQSMLQTLPELATTLIRALEGRRLEADDFDRLFSDDPVRDVLVWLSDPKSVSDGWAPARRSAFTSRCKADFGFDPDKDGELVAAERLGRREGSWETVWNRFAESPALYPGIRELLRKSMPFDDLFAQQSPSWPQNNEKGELDKLGHSLQGKLAARVDDQIALLLERIESLLDAGWREVLIVTDHGWLWLPGGLPKVDLPKYLTQSRWARCASIKGDSTVRVPTFPGTGMPRNGSPLARESPASARATSTHMVA